MGPVRLGELDLLSDSAVKELREDRALPRRRFLDAVTRTIDILVAVVGLAAFSPLLLIVALLIRADGGPVFYRQRRLGRDGQCFRIVKFRSMVVDAEARGAKLRSTHDDPRITRIGRFLREYHVDEIPQLFNVLAGQMSLVGPRPALPFHVDYYEPWEMARLSVRPGMTGLSQVSGGNALNWDQRIIIDVHHVRRRSFGLYVSIIWRTFTQLFKKKGIYGQDGQVKGWTRPVPDWYRDSTMNAEPSQDAKASRPEA